MPDAGDLSHQTAAGVCPSPSFQYYLYDQAYRSGQTIVEFHTHPGPDRPHFSGIDESHAYPNAEYIAGKFPEPVTLALIVGNDRFDSFDGVVYDRHRQHFRQLDRLELLGRPTITWTLGDPAGPSTSIADDTFDRQQRIPGWNQAALEDQRIAIVGAGGNGAPLLQSLVAIGAGKRGFIAIADHDLVENSNLPRIPYAHYGIIHTPKVAAATFYAATKSPSTPLYAFPCRFNEPPVLARFKMATVLFYCGDNDGGRKEVNQFAVRYGIPLIDLGCDIHVSDACVEAGGQVRLVLPGENACLLCSRAFDPAQAALDQMSDIARAEQAARGYVIGADANPTPSVANLNALTVQFALSQFLALVNGPQFAQWDYLHFDQFTGRTIPATTSRHDKCPVCGPTGCLTQADPTEQGRRPPRSTRDAHGRSPANAESADPTASQRLPDDPRPAPEGSPEAPTPSHRDAVSGAAPEPVSIDRPGPLESHPSTSPDSTDH